MGEPMTTWITRLLDEDAVYWEPPQRGSADDYIWVDPIALKSRFQFSYGSTGGAQLRFESKGSVVSYRHSVWVSEAVTIGGYLWKGSIVDLGVLTPPPDTAYKVRTLEFTRSITTQDYLYKVYLDV